jgi:hypothetical protein
LVFVIVVAVVVEGDAEVESRCVELDIKAPLARIALEAFGRRAAYENNDRLLELTSGAKKAAAEQFNCF